MPKKEMEKTLTPLVSINDFLIDAFNERKTFLPGKNLAHVNKLRESAAAYFRSVGIPGKKTEDYKYCNFNFLSKEKFSFASEISQINYSKHIIDNNAINVFLINGKFDSIKTNIEINPEELILISLKEAFLNHGEEIKAHYGKCILPDSDPFSALNSFLSADGVFLKIKKDRKIETPIYIYSIQTGKNNFISLSRNLLIAESNSEVSVFEINVTDDLPGRSFSIPATEIFADTGANINYFKLQDECENGNLVNITYSYQLKSSRVSFHTFSFGGSFTRNNLIMVLDDQDCEANLNGLYFSGANQFIDNHTLVDHRKPNCRSNELYKGLADNKSTAVFNGKIFVRKDAQKTNAFQSNKNVLLSDDATINTKPQLEIYANDVKCSHGSTTGKINQEALFYLRSRGISEESAKRLMIIAFADELISGIESAPFREFINMRFQHLLNR